LSWSSKKRRVVKLANTMKNEQRKKLSNSKLQFIILLENANLYIEFLD
jgi:hypothetical protein